LLSADNNRKIGIFIAENSNSRKPFVMGQAQAKLNNLENASMHSI